MKPIILFILALSSAVLALPAPDGDACTVTVEAIVEHFAITTTETSWTTIFLSTIFAVTNDGKDSTSFPATSTTTVTQTTAANKRDLQAVEITTTAEAGADIMDLQKRDCVTVTSTSSSMPTPDLTWTTTTTATVDVLTGPVKVIDPPLEILEHIFSEDARIHSHSSIPFRSHTPTKTPSTGGTLTKQTPTRTPPPTV